MEDDAILDAFAHLHDGADFDRLYDAALCRAKADWLVGINATRLFSVLYHCTLNVGRVVSPTLALIVHRDAEIRAFQPERYYTVSLTFPDFTAFSEKFKFKADADAALAACEFHARACRAHNNANVLCLGERVTGPGVAADLADIFLNTDFEGGRHLRRVELFDKKQD